jgi:hypothetical protein
MSMKNTNDTIGNRSCDLLVCSTVPQALRHRVPPTARVGRQIICLLITNVCGTDQLVNNFHLLQHFCFHVGCASTRSVHQVSVFPKLLFSLLHLHSPTSEPLVSMLDLMSLLSFLLYFHCQNFL